MVKVDHLTLGSRPCHTTVIDIAEDDGDAEAAHCTCGAQWRQCDGPYEIEWYWTHTAPPPQTARVVATRLAVR